MASEVDIANLALAHLGDAATVSSFDPPEGSAQAEHCAQFYPIARDELLEMHQWNFNTTRLALSPLSTPPPAAWQYAYGLPNNVLNAITVMAVDAGDDASVALPTEGSYVSSLDAGVGSYQASINSGEGIYTPQPYSIETLADGSGVLYTNQNLAVLRYSQRITDPTKFSPLFVTSLSWKLAGYLAGPVLKGEAGRQAAVECEQMFDRLMARATLSDAKQRNMQPAQSVGWIIGR